jgi:3-hydroxy-5-phosphonooxypentane-2,4-dione thiolase
VDWGMKNRLARIIQPQSGRVVMFAVDHGYFLGPTSGLEDFNATVDPLLPYADCLMLTRGMLRNCVDPAGAPPIMMRMSGGNSILGELSDEGLTCSVEDAIRMGASGITLSIYVGSENQHRTLINLGHLVNQGQRYGLPVMAVTAVGKDMVRDVRYLSLCCRMAAEIGCQIVKTYYCDDFEKLVKSTPVPVVIAGGKKVDEPQALEMAANAIRDGAAGVDMGRNIFQSENPVAMIKAVRAVVHENLDAKKGYQMYQDLAASG